MEVCFKFDQPSPDILNQILQNQTQIMALIDDLKTQVSNLQTQVAEFQTALDAEQAQVQSLLDNNAAVVTDLNNQIAALNAQIAAGATPEQLQELANGITTIADNLATTKADLEGTVNPSQGNGTEPTV